MAKIALEELILKLYLNRNRKDGAFKEMWLVLVDRLVKETGCPKKEVLQYAEDLAAKRGLT